MEEQLLKEFYPWRVLQLNEEQSKTIAEFEIFTGLNVHRFLSGEHSTSGKTLIKILDFYSITLDVFHKTYPEFLAEKTIKVKK